MLTALLPKIKEKVRRGRKRSPASNKKMKTVCNVTFHVKHMEQLMQTNNMQSFDMGQVYISMESMSIILVF